MNIFRYISYNRRTPLLNRFHVSRGKQGQRDDARPNTVELSAKGIKNFPPLAGGIKGGGEKNNRLWSDYFATLTQPLPSRERSMHLGLSLRIMYIMVFMLLICADSVFASLDFVSSEIDTGGNRQGYWAADLNGDSLKDILIATWSETNGREFLIYTQEANGKFTGSPWRRIEIKKDIVAFTLADVRPDPGSELLFFTGSACYSLSCAKEGYAGNLKKLFEWELIKSVPDKKKVDFIGELKDLNNDSFVDIILPGQKQYALFLGQSNEIFSKASILPAADVIINKSSRTRESFSITTGGVSAGGSDIYSDLMDHRLDSRPVNKNFFPPILNFANWIPGISTGRFNADELDDFVYLDDAETEKLNIKRLNLIYQPKTGELPSTPDWQANITINDDIRMMDVNGDNLTDLVTSKLKGLNTTLYIYLNRDGRFNFDTPDHVMKLTGIMSDFQAIDFNRDGYQELVINTYSASPVKAVASGSIERRLLIFAGQNSAEGVALFDRKPAFTYEENFNAGNFKSLTGERSFSGDIDGDGINDVVSIDSNGALAANRITHEFKFEAEPVLSFTPMHYISGTRLISLNQDNRTDIIVEHERGLSLIISQKGARQ